MFLYYILRLSVSVKPWDGIPIRAKLAGPSMHVLIENMKRIQNKEFWIFPETESPISYKSKLVKNIRDSSDREAKESVYIKNIGLLLCYDYIGYIRDQGLPKTTSICKIIQKWPYYDNIKEDIGGLTMPLERFLEIMEDYRLEFDNEKQIRAFHKQEEIMTSKFLSKCFHKEQNPKGEKETS